MPARAKGKTPGRPARKSARQTNDSLLGNPGPGTPGWHAASIDMFASPSFTPPQSPPRSRQVRGGRVTKAAKPDTKGQRRNIVAATKVTSPALTRGRRATMLPSELVIFKSPPVTRRRASIYQKPGAAPEIRRGAKDFKMPDPVAILRSKKASPKKSTAVVVKKKSPIKQKSPAKPKSPPKKTKSPPKKTKSPPKKTKSPSKTSRTTPAREAKVTPSRSAKLVKEPSEKTAPKAVTKPTSVKKSPVAKVTKTSPKITTVTAIKTPRATRNLTETSVNTSSFYSSPKVDTPAVAKLKVTAIKTPMVVTPVNKPVERLRIGTESLKKVKIMSEKSDSLTKVYRKTPTRGPAGGAITAAATLKVTHSSTGTPIKAARILGKTPGSGKKLPVKPKKLAESPKTSTPRELRKRRADFPEVVSEIRLTKKIALEATANDESIAEITADLSVSKLEDVRPNSWWGWCNIL